MTWVGSVLGVRSWSVRHKLIALLVAASVLPLVLDAVIDIRSSRAELRAATADLLAAHADQLRGQLDAFHHGYLRSASDLTRVPALAALVDAPGSRPASPAAAIATARALLESHQAADRDVVGIAVLDLRGRVVVATDVAIDYLELGDRGYVREAMRGEPVISAMHVPAPALATSPVVAYAAPIKLGPQARLAGLVVLWVNGDAVADLARGANDLAGHGSFAVILDGDGIRIAHSLAEHSRVQPAGVLAPDRIEELVAERRFGDDTRQKLQDVEAAPELFARARTAAPDLAMFEGNAPGSDVPAYGVARQLATMPWTVACMVPVATLEDQIAIVTHDKLILVGLITLVAFAVGLGLAQVILRPVVSLSAATSRIAGGDLSARVAVGGDDELGRLCVGFNTMAERLDTDAAALRRSRDELEDRVAVRTGELVRAAITEARAREALEASAARLELLSRTAHELATASDDAEAVLELAVHRIGEAIGDLCTIRLISEDGAWLEPTRVIHQPAAAIPPEATAAARQVVAQLLGGTRTAIHEGMAGRVAATGEALRLPELSQGAALAAIPPAFHAVVRALGISSLLAVPLRSRGRTIGVVILLRSQPGNPYTVDDQRFAQDVADRAGLAIDNAVLVETLERRVAVRTAALETANHELEAFSYSVSHDLRAPLRTIDGFSDILLADHAAQLDGDAQRYLQRIRVATQRMAALIDDLLNLARITRTTLRWHPIDLTALAGHIASELGRRDPTRTTLLHVAPGLASHGDARLVTIALENLLGNAWKFTAKTTAAEIWLGSEQRDGRAVFFVRDTGAGFDMKYADKLFLPFHRLHTADEFEGVGVGLATVHRIIAHHGGRIWAEATLGGGATFFFFLGAPA